MPTDSELLRQYAHDNDQGAFREFVRRNIGLVYSAALRRTEGRGHLAEEVVQKVFCDASRKAVALASHPAITGWLYQGTRYAALDALRSEKRREGVAQAISSMHEEPTTPEDLPDWDRLRPLLDKELDALRDGDRELVLLRFFQKLGYAEIGTRLGLSENAARKRTDRALEILRSRFVRRGLTSSSAALATTLAHASFGAVPASLASKVATVAMVTQPVTGLAGFLTLIMMNKLTAPLITAVLTAGLTTAVWSASQSHYNAEIATLQAEYGRLHKATSANGTPEELAAAALDYASKASAISQSMRQRQSQLPSSQATKASSASSELSPQGYKNQGQQSAEDAAYSFAWACDLADPVELAKLTYIEEGDRARAQQLLDTMPQAVREAYATPEEFFGFLLAAACLEAPPPSAALARRFMNIVEISPVRVATRRTGSDLNMHEYQLTPTGWKYVLPRAGIEGLPSILNSSTLAKLSQKP